MKIRIILCEGKYSYEYRQFFKWYPGLYEYSTLEDAVASVYSNFNKPEELIITEFSI